MAELPQRRTIRWKGYDYAQEGAYYLTICTQDRLHLFGRIADGVMHPSPIGEWAQRCWNAIPDHMVHVDVGDFVVMPNHVHGIVVIRERLVRVDRALADPVGADHDRPDTMQWPDTMQRPDTMPDDGAMPQTGTPDDHAANAPRAHMRADHDRPLRPPAPPTNATTGRPMPIVPHGSLGRIVASYKSAVTRMAYRDGLVPHGTPIWQRNYWDHVIRDDAEQERIAKYIQDNPKNWKGDRFNR